RADGRHAPLWYAARAAGAAALRARADLRRGRLQRGAGGLPVPGAAALARCGPRARARAGAAGLRRGPQELAVLNALTLWVHQIGSPPTFYRIAGAFAPWLFAIALVLGAVALYGGLFVAPRDYQQGDAYRIIFVHVPCAWMSLFAYIFLAVNAFIALVWRI